MCRPHLPISVAILLHLGAPRPAIAQSSAEYGKRYAALMHATSKMNAYFDSASKHRLVPGSIDTIRVGALVVLTAPSLRSRARAAADSAWGLLTRVFGAEAALASGTPLLLESADRGDSGSLASAVNATVVQVPKTANVMLVARGMLATLGPAIYGHADNELKRWLPWVYADTVLRLHLDAVYEELATSPWSAGQACFEGNFVACRLALGISRVDPVTGWYNAADRRRYVQHVLAPSTTAARDCVDGGDDQACIVSLKRAPGGSPGPPLGAQARQFLLALAINAGGQRSYERLIAGAGGPLEDRIAAAANLPIDSLVSRWHAQVVAARPKTVAADARAAWAAVAWGVVLMVVALRSTRWR